MDLRERMDEHTKRWDSENDSLPIVLDEAFNVGGVHLIDLPVDYSDNVKNLISDLAEHEAVI